jgi:hypothetical protein
MINQQLIDFIKLQSEKGINKEIITKELLGNGWEMEDIEEGFKAIETPPTNQDNNPTPPSVNNVNLTPISIKTQNNSKKRILVVIIILILIIAGAYFFSKSKTVDFRTKNEIQNTLPNPYINDEYNFTFTYPKEITFSIGKSSEYNPLKLDSTYSVYYENNITQAFVKPKLPLGSMIVGEKTYQQYVETFKKSNDLNNISEKKIEKNGLIWSIVSVVDNDNSPAMTIAITERDNLNYTLFLLNTPTIDGKEAVIGQKELFNSMLEMFLDTFKFIDVK